MDRELGYYYFNDLEVGNSVLVRLKLYWGVRGVWSVCTSRMRIVDDGNLKAKVEAKA